MTTLKTITLAVIIAVIAVLIVVTTTQSNINETQDTTQTKSEPDFIDIKLRTIEGKETTIREVLNEGKPVVLYFFATWCPVCRDDLENLKKVYPDFEDKIKVVVVGFDLSESLEEIKNYADNGKFSGGWIFVEPNGDLITSLEVITQATKLIISLDGEIIYREGYSVMSVDKWRSVLSSMTE